MADLNTNQIETLGIVSEVIADASFTVLSMLLGREIDMIPMRSAILNQSEVEELGWQKVIIAKANFTKGLEGTIFFVMNIEDATRIIDLMLGGEGEPAIELDEDSSDALSETINQIMGASCQTFTEKTGQSISIGQVEIHNSGNAAIINEQVGSSEFPGVEFSLDLETLINSKMFVGLNQELLNSLDNGLHRKKDAAKAAAAPGGGGAPPQQQGGGGGQQQQQNQPQQQYQQGPPPGYPPQGYPPPGYPPQQQQAYPPQAYHYEQAPIPSGNIDLLMDIELPVIIRIGRTELLLQDILKLTPGAIIELNKTMDDPIDMLVNNKLIARGEVVVVDGNFAFRITEIVSPAARIKSLG